MSEAYERLRRLIVRGRLAPGTRIVERNLAQRLGIGRTRLRSALQRLQQEGYVTSAGTGRQTRLSVAPLTIDDARDLFAIVANVEGLAARLAAELGPGARSELVAQLRDLNADLLRASANDPPDTDAIFEYDRDFHRTYVEAAAGPRLLALHDAVKPQAERYNRLYTRALVPQIGTSVVEHDRIIEAIAAGDLDEAERTVRTNFLNAARRLSVVIAALGERGSW
jgi:DNA-binding GntR family transcriptional regulator